MSLVISKVFTYDEDAATYIQAVEAADAQALEPATRKAINNFVIGCKQDGIWTAIKASCILSGARTLAGALVPLVGTAPTNNGPFVSGDYNRKTGLVGNGTSKYLNSNRANNADPQTSAHLSFYISAKGSGYKAYIGNLDPSPGSQIAINPSTNNVEVYINGGSAVLVDSSPAAGFLAGSRQGTLVTAYYAGRSNQLTTAAAVHGTTNHFVFARQASGVVNLPTDARLAFYSIGESLDLARLDSRVTALINAFAAAIP